MKKSMIFSLLLLAAVIATGCGSSSDWTPPGASRGTVYLAVPNGTPTEYELKAGVASDTINLNCTNSAIDMSSIRKSDMITNPSNPTLTRVGACGFTFSGSTPGTYTVTVTAIRDRSEKQTFRFVVKPDFTIDGSKKVLPEATAVYKAAGTGTQASLDAGSVVNWTFTPAVAGIGDVSPLTGASTTFTATEILGTGTLKAVMLDKITGVEVSAILEITVAEQSIFLIGGVKPPELAGFPPSIGTTGLWFDRPQPNNAVTCPPYGCYDGTLDTLNIPDRAYVYTATGPLPEEIAGYGSDKVADIVGDDYGVLKAGQWATYSYESFFGPYTYVIIVPKFMTPGELPGTPSIGTTGLWFDRPQPNNAVTCPPYGCYDGTLDTLNIPDLAYVYTATGPLPEEIAGYGSDKVADIVGDDYGVLKAGQWATYSYESFFGPYTYIIIIPNDFVASDP